MGDRVLAIVCDQRVSAIVLLKDLFMLLAL